MKKIYYLLIGCIFTFSCQPLKDSPDPNLRFDRNDPELADYFSDTGVDIDVKDNRLVFKDLNVLDDFIQRMKNADVDKLNTWSQKFNFENFEGVYQELSTNGKIADMEFLAKNDIPVVPDPLLRRVINSKGVYQIGHKVIKIGFESAIEQNEIDYNIQPFVKNIVIKEVFIEGFLKYNTADGETNKHARSPADFVGNIYGLLNYHPAGPIFQGHIWNVAYPGWKSFGFEVNVTNGQISDQIILDVTGNWKKQPFGSWQTISFHPRTYNSTYCGGTYESDVTTFNPRYKIEGIFTLSVVHNGITLNGDGGNF